MPAYEYECQSCDKSVTVVRSINDPEKKPVCVGCGQVMVRDYKVTGVSFKGNGWGKQAR